MKRAAIVPVYANSSHVQSLYWPGVIEGAYRVATEKFKDERVLAMILLADCKIWEVVTDPGVLKYINCPKIGEIEL